MSATATTLKNPQAERNREYNTRHKTCKTHRTPLRSAHPNMEDNNNLSRCSEQPNPEISETNMNEKPPSESLRSSLSKKEVEASISLTLSIATAATYNFVNEATVATSTTLNPSTKTIGRKWEHVMSKPSSSDPPAAVKDISSPELTSSEIVKAEGCDYNSEKSFKFSEHDKIIQQKIKRAYIPDPFSKECEKAQNRPFLHTGKNPQVGMRVELLIFLNSDVGGDDVEEGKNPHNNDNDTLSRKSKEVSECTAKIDGNEKCSSEVKTSYQKMCRVDDREFQRGKKRDNDGNIVPDHQAASEASEQSRRALPFRISGEVVEVRPIPTWIRTIDSPEKTMLEHCDSEAKMNNEYDQMKLRATDSYRRVTDCDSDSDGNAVGKLSSSNSGFRNWRPSASSADSGPNGGSLDLVDILASIMDPANQKKPKDCNQRANDMFSSVEAKWDYYQSDCVDPSIFTFQNLDDFKANKKKVQRATPSNEILEMWERLSNENKQQISEVVVSKLGARHGQEVVCEARYVLIARVIVSSTLSNDRYCRLCNLLCNSLSNLYIFNQLCSIIIK